MLKKLPSTPPNKNTVQMLKDLLARAETGEAQCLVFVTLNLGGEITMGFSVGDDLLDFFRLVGALEFAKSDLVKAHGERMVEEE